MVTAIIAIVLALSTIVLIVIPILALISDSFGIWLDSFIFGERSDYKWRKRRAKETKASQKYDKEQRKTEEERLKALVGKMEVSVYQVSDDRWKSDLFEYKFYAEYTTPSCRYPKVNIGHWVGNTEQEVTDKAYDEIAKIQKEKDDQERWRAASYTVMVD